MYLINKNLFFFILIITGIMSIFGCTTDEPDLGPTNEEFVGIYIVRDSTEVEALGQIDSVHFHVNQGTTYSLSFYDSTGVVDFCDHSGTILDFGTAKASFDPYAFSYNNCDTLTVPRGTFTADFINFGDTILIFKEISDMNASPAYDSVFILKLLK